MSTYVVFGEAGASQKIINAAMNDYLDTHQNYTPDEDFAVIVVCRPRQNKTVGYVIEWCEKAGVYFEQITSSDAFTFSEAAADTVVVEDPMLVAVERGYAYESDKAVVLALVGEDDPSVDVRRAIERAVDSHMVVRDLTEAGLTYILFSGDSVEHPPHTEEPMADEAEEMTLEELVALAAEGDAEAVEALTEACGEFDIDPDEYATWEEVGELLEAALGGEEEEEEEAEEDVEEDVEEAEEEEESGEGGWTTESLKGLTLKEVREHAKAAGIDNWKTATRPTLVKALIEGTSEDGEEEAKPASRTPKVKTEVGDLPAFDIDTLADAIIDRLIARLK